MNDGPEHEDDEIERLRAEVADLRRKIALIEGDRPPSGDRWRCSPVPDAPTAFTLGVLTMMTAMLATIALT